MKFVSYTSWDQLPDSADELFSQAEKNSIFYSRPWFESLVSRALDADQEMLLAAVLAGNRLMAILPLMKTAGSSWYSLRHRYTTHFSLLMAEDEQEHVLACLVQGLTQFPVRGFLLEPVAENDAHLNALMRTMQHEGYLCERRFRSYNWIYRVRGNSHETYMADRPAKLRNTIARKKRKLQREHGYEIRLFIGEEVPGGMSDYHAVYTASWKANEQYSGFLDSIVAGFSKQGWSRLAVMYVRDKPVAAQLWFVAHAKASIFRLSYDKAWKSYSPGSILTSFLMAYVIDTDRVEEIDFLTGNDAYKQDWMGERRERYVLSCIKPAKPGGVIKRFFDLLGNRLKRQN